MNFSADPKLDDMINIEIIKEKCPAQKEICQPLLQCPRQAITYVEDFNEMMGGRMEIENTKCDGCAICVDLCCGQAILLIN